MRIILIAAMTQDRLIGQDGKLPWHVPADLKHFKQTTMGHAVIMGRKTFDSCGRRPLPGRRNIVISRSADIAAQTAHAPDPEGKTTVDFATGLDAALELCRQRGEGIAFVIGGAQIFTLALPIADEMIITYIPAAGLSGDTYFPAWPVQDWLEEPFPTDLPIDVRRYRRRK